MSADLEDQEDELLALQSIFDSEEFIRDESKSAGEIRVSVDLPANFSVVLKDGETLRQYELSFLPPLLLTFELPEDYPSSSPPCFTLTCSWLTHTQLAALSAQLTDLYQASGGAVVLFSWVQFLREDALRFLDIHNVLELPSDGYSTLQDKQNTSHHSQNGLNSGPNADDQHTLSSETMVQKQTAQTSDVVEVEQTFQMSEFKADTQSDLSSGEDKSKRLPFAQSDQMDEEDLLNEGDVSASLLLPSSSSDPTDPSEQGAASLPVHPRESPQNKDQTVSGLSLTPSQTLLSQILIYDAAQKHKVFATTVFDCGVCFVGWLGSECVQLSECGHVFCQACLGEFCKLQITEGNVRGVTCPQADCTATPTPAQVKSLVGEELFSRYDRLLLQSTLDRMPDVAYCPRRSCGSPVILEKSSTAALCSVCDFAFCVACRKTYHGPDDCQAKTKMTHLTDCLALPRSSEGREAIWDDYVSGSKQRKRLLESRYGRNLLQFILETGLSENWISNNSKSCPHCFCKIEKDGGCNRMMCSQCRQQFCWTCLTRLSPLRTYAHFEDGTCSLLQLLSP